MSHYLLGFKGLNEGGCFESLLGCGALWSKYRISEHGLFFERYELII
jgi:hypothetical protein